MNEDGDLSCKAQLPIARWTAVVQVIQVGKRTVLYRSKREIQVGVYSFVYAIAVSFHSLRDLVSSPVEYV